MSMKKLMFTLLMCASLGFVGCGNGPSNPDNGGDGGGQTCDPACKDTEVCKDGQCKAKEQTGDPTVCDPECGDGKKCENGTCVDDTTTSGPDVKLCGNGVKDPGETCDPEALSDNLKCHGKARCEAKSNGCDKYTFSLGSDGNQCTEQCTMTKVTEAINDDGCCPPGMTLSQDNDCVPYQVCEKSEDCKGGDYGDTCYNDPQYGKKGYCVDFVARDDNHTCADTNYSPAHGKSVSTCLFKCSNTVACPGDTQCEAGLCQPYEPPKPPPAPTNAFPKAGADCTQSSDCAVGLDPAERANNAVCLPFKSDKTSEREENQGGFCALAGCGDTFACPTGSTCWNLGGTGVCLLDCDPTNPTSLQACTDAGEANVCVPAGNQGKYACFIGAAECTDDTDCADQANFTCEARGLSTKKFCYLKATGTKVKGDECSVSSECAADSYCYTKDILKSYHGDQTVPENKAKFCTNDCATDADCAGIPDTHCVDFAGNGRGYCSAVTTCTDDTECSAISAQLTCQDVTLHGGGTVKMCMEKP